MQLRLTLLFMLFASACFSQYGSNIRLDPSQDPDSIHLLSTNGTGPFADRGIFRTLPQIATLLQPYLQNGGVDTIYIQGDSLVVVDFSGDTIYFQGGGFDIADVTFGGDVSGPYNDLQLGTGVVGNAEIFGDAITHDKIATDAVRAGEIQAGAVGTSEIATNGVGADEIINGSVGQDEIATDGVSTAEIIANGVGSDEIQPDAVGISELENSIDGNAEGFSMFDMGDLIFKIRGSGFPEHDLVLGDDNGMEFGTSFSTFFLKAPGGYFFSDKDFVPGNFPSQDDTKTLAITYDDSDGQWYTTSLAQFALAAHSHAFSDITGKPTTIGGYGITDFNSLGDARWIQLTQNFGGDVSGVYSNIQIGSGVIGDTELGTGIDVSQFANGSIDNTEFQYLNGASSNIQDQLNALGGAGDHGTLTGLSDDDHAQYALLAGRSSGQTLIGGTSTTADLSFQTTSAGGLTGADMHFLVGNNGATEAMTILNNGRVGVMNNSPTAQLHLARSDGDLLFGDNAFPGKQASTDGGIEFTDSGRLRGGLFTEVDGSILTYGINAVPILGIGARDMTKIGGMFRLDTRAAQNYFAVIRYPTGTDNYQFDLGLNANGDMVLYNVANSTPTASTKLHVMMQTTTKLPLQEIENLSTGDAALQFSISGDSYAMGIDNADNDLFKISYNTSVGLATLGTNDLLKINQSGAMTVTGDVSVPDEAFGAGWNASLETPTKNAVYDEITTFQNYVATYYISGSYLPTASAESNLDASVTPTEAQYMRVGNVVTVSGGFNADATGGGPTSFELSLPISGDISNIHSISGVGHSGELYFGTVQIRANTTNKTAEFVFTVTETDVDLNDHYYSYSFTYTLL